MFFDFERFADIVASVYQDGDGLYSQEDVLFVFRHYFQKYEERMGQPHPPIKAAQVLRIIQVMPWASQEDVGNYSPTVEPDHYPDMIDRHFRTKYRECDYNINHFFSGRIRELRWLEVCYR